MIVCPFVLKQAPPLPKWPINWSIVGMRIETLLAVDPNILVEKLNEIGRPGISIAMVDAETMAAEVRSTPTPTFFIVMCSCRSHNTSFCGYCHLLQVIALYSGFPSGSM